MTEAKQMTAPPSTTEYEALKRLEAWDGLQRLDTILDDLRRRPNFFLVAPRVLRVEGVHSDMLAWLLDPRGWHGLSDGFARAFLSAVLADCGVDAAGPLRVDEVHREFSTGNGPIDILMRVHYGDVGVVVGVDNKIDSPEGEDQLKRYQEGLKKSFPGDLLALVFLTPDGVEPQSLPDECKTLAYSTVAEHIDAAISEALEPADATGLTLARHYLAALRAHIMTESNPDIDEICRQLYDAHQEAWRAIRRRLPSKRDEFHFYVGSKVTEHLKKLYGGSWQSVVRRDKFACVFRPAWSELGYYETDQIVGLNQAPDSPRTYPRVHFRLVADRAETDTGDRFQYRVRLKVDTAKNPKGGKALVRALKLVDSIKSKIPNRTQFTLSLKSTSKLPPLGDEPEDVPDSVVDWFSKNTAELVPVLDSVLGKK
jgi:hypothetical protein